MFQPVVTETLDVAQQSADKDPSSMDDAQIRQIMEAAPLMRQLLEGVEKEALRRLESGQSIPGLKLVNGRGSRAWALPEDQMAEKLIEVGIPKTAVYETKLVSPAKAEKLVRLWWSKPIDQVIDSLVRAKIPKRQITQALLDQPASLPVFTWVNRNSESCSLSPRQVEILMRELTLSADELLKRMDQEYVSKLAGKLTVVPESDSRPAVITNAAPLFSAVETPAELPAWLS